MRKWHFISTQTFWMSKTTPKYGLPTSPFEKCLSNISSEITSKQFCLVAKLKNAIAKVVINSKYFHSHASFDIFKAKKIIGKSSDPYRT